MNNFSTLLVSSRDTAANGRSDRVTNRDSVSTTTSTLTFGGTESALGNLFFINDVMFTF